MCEKVLHKKDVFLVTSTTTPHFCFTFSTTLLTLTTALLIYFNVVIHSVSSSVFLCV